MLTVVCDKLIPGGLLGSQISHECATSECALQVVRDLTQVCEDDMARGLIFGYVISFAHLITD